MEVASLLAGPRHRQTTLSCGSGTVLVERHVKKACNSQLAPAIVVIWLYFRSRPYAKA